MPRRVSLPGASELFRPTSSATGFDPVAEATEPTLPEVAVPEVQPEPEARPKARRTPARKQAAPAVPASAPDPAVEQKPARTARRQASGRVRHDEKITVYVSRDELIALEQARLMMRADFGLGVDRGRIVRESIALAMAQLETLGAEAPLVQRLREA